MILLALLAGFALYFLRDFAESLGGQGDIPILVAAWTRRSRRSSWRSPSFSISRTAER